MPVGTETTPEMSAALRVGTPQYLAHSPMPIRAFSVGDQRSTVLLAGLGWLVHHLFVQ